MVREIMAKNKLQLMEDLTLWEDAGRITMSREAKIQLIDFILGNGMSLHNDLMTEVLDNRTKTGSSIEKVFSEQYRELTELIIELDKVIEAEVKK